MPEGERRNSECYNKNIRCLEGDNRLKEAELYKDLGKLTKEKNKWKDSIPYVSSLLKHESVKIQAKAL